MADIRLITLDPAHFHAALIHKEMVPGIDPTVHVFAPLGPELAAHVQHLAGFNSRRENPTAWRLEVHAGPDFLEQMLRDPPGDAVVLAGRNHTKIDTMLACVEAGLHVFADKPWIIRHADFPKLERLVQLAAEKGVVVYDMMTERHEITSILQRELINDPELFGSIAGLQMISTHVLKKLVAGLPLRRPAEFFDIERHGEGLADVGTHLVDLANWMLAPEQIIDRRRDLRRVAGGRSSTPITLNEYQQITAECEFPEWMTTWFGDGRFAFFGNGFVAFRLRNIDVGLTVNWEVELLSGDRHRSEAGGARALIRISQLPGEPAPPELDVIPNDAADRDQLGADLRRKVAELAERYPGLGVIENWDGFRVTIPDVYRVGHEAHFAQVAAEFLRYVRNPGTMPAWEMPNLLTKYYITTKGVQLAWDEADRLRREAAARDD